MKKECAQKALEMVKDEMVVGLGGGNTIAILIELIKQSNKKLKIVTPSYKTAMLCNKAGLELLPTWSVDSVDIAFDGCDELDKNLNALKSGGAIHTKEKIIASIAREYVLLADESKLSNRLTFQHPVVLEVIPEAYAYVKKAVTQLGATVTDRESSAKDGMTMSDHGNMILEAYFEEVEDIQTLNQDLLMITGIVDTSLFYQIACKAIVAYEDEVKILEC